MSKSVRGFKWLVGGLVGVSLLGACGAPADGENTAGQSEEQAAGDGDCAGDVEAFAPATAARICLCASWLPL